MSLSCSHSPSSLRWSKNTTRKKSIAISLKNIPSCLIVYGSADAMKPICVLGRVKQRASLMITKIPRSVPMPEQQTVLQKEEASPASYKLILVVEDDIPFGSILIQTIKEETPYQAILATTGMEALNIASHLQCDLFLLDYLLPSMNGLELYDRLHAIPGHEKTPAFFLSASTRLPHQELAKRNLKSLSKLVELDELLKIIRESVSPGESTA